MKYLLKELVSDVLYKFKVRSIGLIFSMIFNGLMGGISIALLLPLLNFIGIGSVQVKNSLSNLFNTFFNAIGLSLTLELLLFLIICISIIQNAIFFLQSWLAARIQNDYIAVWRKILFSKYMMAKWSFFVKNKLGNLINTIIIETSRLGGAFYLMSQLLSTFVISIIYLIIAYYASWLITSSILITGISLLISTKGLVKKGYLVGKGISRYNGIFESTVNEFISGAKVIKATSTEELAGRKFSSVVDELKALNYWASLQPNLLKIIFDLASIVLLCLFLYISSKYMHVDPAVILIIAALFLRLMPRFYGMQQNLQLLGVYLPAIETILAYHNEAVNLAEYFMDSKDNEIFFNKVEITFKDVTLSYRRKKVLSNATMNIPLGKTIGIIGSSGAGKTTLVDCILKLIDPEEGSIYVNGVPLQRIPLRSWRKRIGYVSQETFLFHDSIRNNILWNAENTDEGTLIKVSKIAHIYDFIKNIPDGYDAIVGDKGVRVSVGQKQRIGLARALINRPSLLLLDEVTSALDSESEQVVLKAIDKLHGKMTIIMIAHRISTVKNVDLIFVIENGEIVEQGTWNDLIKKNGRFYQLKQLQNTNKNTISS